MHQHEYQHADAPTRARDLGDLDDVEHRLEELTSLDGSERATERYLRVALALAAPSLGLDISALP